MDNKAKKIYVTKLSFNFSSNFSIYGPRKHEKKKKNKKASCVAAVCEKWTGRFSQEARDTSLLLFILLAKATKLKQTNKNINGWKEMKFKTELFMTQFQWKTEKKRINIKKKQNANFTLSEDRN